MSISEKVISMAGKHEKRKRKLRFFGGYVQDLYLPIASIISLGIVLLLLYLVAASTIVYPLNSYVNCEIGRIGISLRTQEKAQEIVSDAISDFKYKIIAPNGKIYEVGLSDLTDQYGIKNITNDLSDCRMSFLLSRFSISLAEKIQFSNEKIQALLNRIAQEQRDVIPSEDSIAALKEQFQKFEQEISLAEINKPVHD